MQEAQRRGDAGRTTVEQVFRFPLTLMSRSYILQAHIFSNELVSYRRASLYLAMVRSSSNVLFCACTCGTKL